MGTDNIINNKLFLVACDYPESTSYGQELFYYQFRKGCVFVT